jgi:holin-like protein
MARSSAQTVQHRPCLIPRPYPEPVIAGLLVLLGCQLAGQLVADGLGLPVPGPVLGLVLLLVWLEIREPAEDSGLARVCAGLLRHLQLLFVPAGVGVVQYLSVIASAAVPLVLGLVVSWLLALLVTAGVAAALFSWQHHRRDRVTGAA